MNIDEFNNKKNDLVREHNEKLIKLQSEYAFSNSTVKIGDMVTDYIGTVKVENILTWRSDIPSCVYRGMEYTKAGKPFKHGGTRDVYQVNLKEK